MEIVPIFFVLTIENLIHNASVPTNSVFVIDVYHKRIFLLVCGDLYHLLLQGEGLKVRCR